MTDADIHIKAMQLLNRIMKRRDRHKDDDRELGVRLVSAGASMAHGDDVVTIRQFLVDVWPSTVLPSDPASEEIERLTREITGSVE